MIATSGLWYHIIAVGHLARSIFRSCVICQKQRAITYNQVMGQLPSTRSQAGHPFLYTGIDYAGPVTLKFGRVRKQSYYKAYICIFVSFSIRAVHLELVTDLTAEAFIAALRRFVSRHRLPRCFHSDHGSNFVKGDEDLRELMSTLAKIDISKSIMAYCSECAIQWSFIQQRAPNFGGLWEATVISIKKHLRSTTMGYALIYEQLMTVLTQIEAILNSRPLVPLNVHDETGLTALTAGHFLIGQPLTALPDEDYFTMKIIRHWNLVQRITREFYSTETSIFFVMHTILCSSFFS